MPDSDNWTVAMVLKWVLTGDLPTVLAMAESYGAVIISGDSLARAVPEDLDAVMIAYCVDPTLPHGEERDKEAVLRSQEVIAAKAEICRALQRGKLEARARRNGSGDVATIAPNQWLALKFQSYRGHDLAVPIGIEQDILKLPHAIEDYLAGRVPANLRPVVWPDPIIPAEQVMQIWTTNAPKEKVASVEAAPRPIERSDKSVPGISGLPGDRPEGVSDRAWRNYLSALEKGYDLGVRGNITNAARAIARDHGHASDFASVRRGLHRVLKKKREQRSIAQIGQ